jgi:hypothetical protein
MKELRKHDFRLCGYPIKIPENEYFAAIRNISKNLSESGIAGSVYTWGSISNPGISDIDFLVIPKDNKRWPLGLKSIYFMKKRLRYLMVHPFMVCGFESAKHIRYIYPDADIKKAFGDDICFIFPSKGELENLRLSLLNDIIIRHLPRDFISVIKSKRINVREMLLRLKSIAYGLNLYKSATGLRIEGSQKYISDITKLRKDWFLIDKIQQENSLMELLNRAIALSLEIIEGFSNFLEDETMAKVSEKLPKSEYFGEKNRTDFLRKWDKEKATDKNYSTLPINLSAQLYCYSKEKGRLSEYIRGHITPTKAKYRLMYASESKKRIRILNKQAELAAKARHFHFPAFFDFGYMPSYGLIGKIAKFSYSVKRLAR